LTGIFFDVAGDPALTPLSAIVPGGNFVLVGSTGVDVTPSNRVVGGEWAYLNGLNQIPARNSGISSSGLGIFGPNDLFPGPNLQGPASPGGLEFGVTSAGDNLSTGNGGLSGQDLIKHSIVFMLGGFSGEPSARILAVTFQYGTAEDEPRFDGHIPEPSSLALAALGFLGTLCAARCRRLRRGRMVSGAARQQDYRAGTACLATYSSSDVSGPM
jgi:hypothetical protein